MLQYLSDIPDFVTTFKWLLSLWSPDLFAAIEISIPRNQAEVPLIAIYFGNRPGNSTYGSNPITLVVNKPLPEYLDEFEELFALGKVKKTTKNNVRELYLAEKQRSSKGSDK